MAKIEYSDEERAIFLELAAEIGITRAKRQLGYPKSWNTANTWVRAAGIEVPLDEIKSQAAAHHDWYKSEELLLVAQEGVMRVHLELQDADLSPDEHKKLSEAFQKYVNTWLLLSGKANSIQEHRSVDNTDIALLQLLDEEKQRNALMERSNEQSVLEGEVVSDTYELEPVLDMTATTKEGESQSK